MHPCCSCDDLQTTVAHIAAENGHTGIIRLLVTRGADVNVATYSGVSIEI